MRERHCLASVVQYAARGPGLLVYPTLFTVAVSPVHSASVVLKKAPGSNPAVRVATLIMFPDAFARVALLEAGHLRPVHAARARVRDVHGSPVESVPAAALDAVGERQDQRWDAARTARAAVRGQQRDCESEENRTHFASEAGADIGEQQPLSSAEEVCSLPPHQPARRDEHERGSVKCRCEAPRPHRQYIPRPPPPPPPPQTKFNNGRIQRSGTPT